MRPSAFALVSLVVATTLAGAPGVDAQSPQIVTLQGTVTLAAVAAACHQTASASQAGAVVVQGNVRDASCNVVFDVPCAVQLDGRSSLKVSNCTVQSQTLNVSDAASAAGSNYVKLTDVTLVGQGDVGLLVRLTDSRDKIVLKNSSADYPRGIVFQTPGSRTLPDQGGKIQVKTSPLTATGPNSSGINISASTRRGNVSVSNSPLTAPAVLVADRCRVTANGTRTDCRASTLAANLARQAHDVTGN